MRWNVLSALALVLSCNDAEVEESSSTSAVTEAEQSSAAPASAAGESSASGPGVPEDFTGTIRDSIALTPEELEAIKQANQLHAKRRPPKQDSRDFGFQQGSGSP